LEEAASLLKSSPKDMVQKVQSFQQEMKSLQRENESLMAKISNAQSSEILSSARQINDITVLSAKVEAKDNNQLRQMMDDLKQKFDKAVIVLGAVDGDKVMLIAGVTKDLAGGNYHAGQIVKHVAEQCGGKGGGRPDMAMAGAKNPEKLEAALESVYEQLK
jgi:alanyl-tRNA synthetase